MSGGREPRAHGRPAGDEREVQLIGGTANKGKVVRVGDTVRRPQRSWSAGTHALLRHLESVGFEGAPRFLGVDAHGREVLTYIAGTAVVPPYPDWALTDAALVSVATLLRDYHRAVSTFDPAPHVWPPSPPHPFAGDVVSHNDPNLDNIVFRDGRAVALIDFDLASPGSRTWDVAGAARLWAPLRPDVHITDARRGHEFERFRLFVDSYGMDDSGRRDVADGVAQNYRWFYDLIKKSAASGHEAFAEYWRTVTSERAEITMQWYEDNQASLRAALGV
jgi:Phosphotransferase enzyme family